MIRLKFHVAKLAPCWFWICNIVSLQTTEHFSSLVKHSVLQAWPQLPRENPRDRSGLCIENILVFVLFYLLAHQGEDWVFKVI
jgi:hypothetical protein